MPWIDVVDQASSEPSRREKAEVEDSLRRRARPRFYADENFPARATEMLRDLGFNVVTVQEAALRGHPDENQLAEARREGRVLVTCDRDYLNEARFPLTQCSTVAVFSFGDGSPDEMARAFRSLSYVMLAPQFYDKWTKIDATPNEWTELTRFQDGSTSRTRMRFLNGLLQVWVEG